MVASSLRLWAHHLVAPVVPAVPSPMADRLPVASQVSVLPADLVLVPPVPATSQDPR
jgi:hypothetical protein